MSTQNFNYIFNITGNASTVLNNIDNGLKSVQSSAKKVASSFGGFEKLIVVYWCPIKNKKIIQISNRQREYEIILRNRAYNLYFVFYKKSRRDGRIQAGV